MVFLYIVTPSFGLQLDAQLQMLGTNHSDISPNVTNSDSNRYVQPRDIAFQGVFEQEGDRFSSVYKMTGFGFAVYPLANMMCQTGPCQYSFEEGILKENPSVSGYTLEGKLKSTSGEGNTSYSRLYTVTSNLQVGETIDSMGGKIDLLDGGFFTIDRVGNYEIVNGSFSFKSGEGVLMLQGEL